jgi:hypothetical protein
VTMPRGIVAVYAMARPRRPEAERAAVIAAAAETGGTVAQRAALLAKRVATAVLADIDAEPDDRVLTILRQMQATPIDVLATDPDIDTAALVLAERLRSLTARAGRRLPEREWAAEDRTIVAVIANRLARRYRRHLADCCRKPG